VKRTRRRIAGARPVRLTAQDLAELAELQASARVLWKSPIVAAALAWEPPKPERRPARLTSRATHLTLEDAEGRRVTFEAGPGDVEIRGLKREPGPPWTVADFVHGRGPFAEQLTPKPGEPGKE